jgi:50S ribosomal protein L16 3-hydroxylase
LTGGAALVRNPASRFTFVRGVAGTVQLFVDGECHDCAGEVAGLAEQLCAGAPVVVGADQPDAAVTLLAALYNHGSVGFEE